MSADNLVNYIPYDKLIKETDEYKQLFFKYMEKEYELIHEMGQLINFKELMDFLYVFSGRAIKIPDPKVILSCLRNLDIYFTLKDKEQPSAEINRMAQKYSISTDKVKNIFYVVSSMVELDNMKIFEEVTVEKN